MLDYVKLVSSKDTINSERHSLDREKRFANHGCEEQITRIKNSYHSTTKTKTNDLKMGRGLDWHFSDGDMQMAKKPVKLPQPQ